MASEVELPNSGPFHLHSSKGPWISPFPDMTCCSHLQRRVGTPGPMHCTTGREPCDLIKHLFHSTGVLFVHSGRKQPVTGEECDYDRDAATPAPPRLCAHPAPPGPQLLCDLKPLPSELILTAQLNLLHAGTGVGVISRGSRRAWAANCL